MCEGYETKKTDGTEWKGMKPCTSASTRLFLLLRLLRSLRNLTGGLVSLDDRLDDTDSNSLPHITNGETTKGRVLVVRLNTHRLRRNQLGNASITSLDELRRRLNGLTSSAIDLLDEFRELAGDVGGVAIKDGGVSGTNLTRVVEDNDLCVEGLGLLGRVVLRVGRNVSTANFLDRDVPLRAI